MKAAREKKQVTYKGTPIRLSADFSAETLQSRREWHDILNVMKGKNLQPRLLYPARLSFRFEGEIKSFADKQKLREFSNTKSALQQTLKGNSLSRQEKATRRNKNTTNDKAHQLRYIYSKDAKLCMHNYATKIRTHEKRWVQMQDTGDELAIKRTTTWEFPLWLSG